MSRRPRDAPPAPGLLASAFSFVSRELESFVTAATGGDVQKTQDQPEASSSRVTLDGKRRKREEGRGERERERDWGRERERRTKRVRKRSEVESDRSRARRKLPEDIDTERAAKVAKKKSVQSIREERERSSEREAADDEDDELSVLPTPRPSKKRREAVGKSLQQREEDVQQVEEPEPQLREKKPQKATVDPSTLMPPPPNPMPPPPSPLTTRGSTPFPTMPGSLFSRSESLIPEPIPAKFQRTRPRTPPPPPTPSANLPVLAEDAEQENEEAAERSTVESPRRGRSQDRRRERSADRRESSRHASRAASTSRPSMDELSERPRSSKGKERACDTSGEIRVQGKERELREAREDHARNAHDRDDSERDRDKQRIRMLEEEVARLRVELALKSTDTSLMPPPPPPPPPPLFRPQIAPTSSGDGTNFLASVRASLKHTAPPVEAPINSVAYGARTRKTGQPTLNLSSDKMAAFLREMKTVRLRKVSGAAGSMGPPSAAGDVAGEPLARSTSGHGMSEARRAAILGDTSFDTGVAARIFIGEKRKRDALEEAAAGPSKRRETTFVRTNNTGGSFAASSQSTASASSSQSSASSASSSSQSSTSSASGASFFDAPLSPRSKKSAPLRIWATRSMETDLTTPSLCSDNENDPSEDRLPDTPSDSSRGHNEFDFVQSVEPRERQPQHEPEIIDVDALETPPRRERSASSVKTEAQVKKDAFARRPPENPMPSKSPVKPRPPARTRTKIPAPAPSKLPLPRRVPVAPPPEEHGSDSDDPLALVGHHDSRPASRSGKYSVEEHDGAPVAGPSRIPREASATSARSRSRSDSQSQPLAQAETAQPRMSQHARRRLTLDEEVRRAGESLWRESSEELERPPSPPQEDLDSGQLVGLGTKSSRRGFLAGGGGAGLPVFMGEGYVQGATATTEDENERGRRPASRSGSAAGVVVTRVTRRR
ncbi:hypothetical protein K466DRAFT_556014 [Polyporus arcularius HHB13444]|uniref:Uncharacterized protein n=1 Tax=Polyporus arcularius HHB13444 TaxID=1314778 RepID=A0A5C3P2J2_9APHY|nr:hypothetical protein K466DRAFT_556014 [Polyporus arcularius HHB13444]